MTGSCSTASWTITKVSPQTAAIPMRAISAMGTLRCTWRVCLIECSPQTRRVLCGKPPIYRPTNVVDRDLDSRLLQCENGLVNEAPVSLGNGQSGDTAPGPPLVLQLLQTRILPPGLRRG